jgi:hypothetical protein
MGFAALTCILIMMEQPWKSQVICNQSEVPQLVPQLDILQGPQIHLANGLGGPCVMTAAREPSALLNFAINSMVGVGSVMIAISVAALVRQKYARKRAIED